MYILKDTIYDNATINNKCKHYNKENVDKKESNDLWW